MNVKEAAQRLNVSERTIQRWLSSGRLKSTREPVPHGNWRHAISLDQLLDAESDAP